MAASNSFHRNTDTPPRYALRSRLLWFHDDPSLAGERAWSYLEDGILVINNGLIEECGPSENILDKIDCPIEHLPGRLITPGFIDTHVHYPQLEMIGAWGEQLLSWLNHYTFPTEEKFADKAYAAQIADLFLDQCLSYGTTTALVFGTVHPQSVDAFFAASSSRNMRMIAGKVLMDRNCPEALQDTPESSYSETTELIERWHGKQRQAYAVTPRFAPTSTPEQLQVAGRLLKENPDVYLHTHLAENINECAWVQELFPSSRHYLDVYDQYGLLGPRSIFAHGIHLCDHSWLRLQETDSALSFCPSSNLFMGSGLFNLRRAEQELIRVGIGSDVGGGTSLSIPKTLGEAYKVCQMRGDKLSPFKAFYLATLGGARVLQLDELIGKLEPGYEADFVVINPASDPIMRVRMQHSRHIFDELFVLTILGDDRMIERTCIAGRPLYGRKPAKK